MPKKIIDFSIPINVLIRDDGTRALLIAIAYYRGEGGSYAGPVRDALGAYTRDFVKALAPSEKKRFDEILETVKTSEAMRLKIAADTPRKVRKRPTRSSLD